MICKVQRSLTQQGERMMVYSEDRRSIWFEGPITDDVVKIMGADLKCFVEAHVVGLPDDFQIDSRLDRREWPTW